MEDEEQTVDVDFVDHVLKLVLGRVLTERSHHRAEFCRTDRSVAVLVEQTERLAKLFNTQRNSDFGLHSAQLCEAPALIIFSNFDS